ncbi:hypothetical protein [Sinorhizobium chiapasense]|uniref:Uncharacterized protein n=1 Tax=Sinorhizobium chiapasense TaxID=501572 RepID=A0ABZ2BD45_9HYPH
MAENRGKTGHRRPRLAVFPQTRRDPNGIWRKGGGRFFADSQENQRSGFANPSEPLTISGIGRLVAEGERGGGKYVDRRACFTCAQKAPCGVAIKKPEELRAAKIKQSKDGGEEVFRMKETK